jgi:hypothetical protein
MPRWCSAGLVTGLVKALDKCGIDVFGAIQAAKPASAPDSIARAVEANAQS